MNTADGTLVIDGEVALIRFERRLSHPIADVWAAVTDPEQLGAWLGEGVVEPRAGGRLQLRAPSGAPPERQLAIAGRVLTWEPPHVFEHEWVQPGLDVSVVRYELERAGAGTILRLTHRRTVGSVAVGGRAGWHAYLDRLAAHLDGRRVPAWSERRGQVQELYDEAPIGGATTA
ncbi:MAG: SRPBCC family protein [Dehalococcoidia bacterium]